MAVGVEQVDRQHQQLLELLGRLEESLASGGAAARGARRIFADLASYTRYHFSTEAHLMRIQEPRNQAAHLAAHDDFTARVAGLEPLLLREGDEAAALEANRFLRSWILRHIVVVDRLTFASSSRPSAPLCADVGPQPRPAAVDSAEAPRPEQDGASSDVEDRVPAVDRI